METKESKLKKEVVVPEFENSDDGSPSWYHYVIVLLVIFGGIWIFSFIINTYTSYSDVKVIDAVGQDETYSYTHKIGNITYNIELSMPLEELNKFNFEIQPNKLDILNTVSFTFSFGEYIGEDNGQVSLASTKLRRYLSLVHFIKFEQEDFISNLSPSCENSTINNRVVTFELNSTVSNSYVGEEENGCIRIIAKNPKEMPHLIDDFIVSLLKNE